MRSRNPASIAASFVAYWALRMASRINFSSISRLIRSGNRTNVPQKGMVGTARFELATSRTPSVRATRLRHVPIKQGPLVWLTGLKPQRLIAAAGCQG
jgi:hypothetical protein